MAVGDSYNSSGHLPSASPTAVPLPSARLRGASADAASDAPPRLSIHRLSARQLLVQAGTYRLAIDSMDGYVDVTSLSVDCRECVVRPPARGQSEDDVAEYRVRDDDLLSCMHQHDRFCQSQSQPQR